MTTLVTGASGFLGRAVVRRLLADGEEVRALVRRADAPLPEGAERLVGDLTDVATIREAVTGCDRVVHAGARVTTTGKWIDFEAVNVDAAREIVAASMREGVRRVVHVSSLAVYAVERDGAVVSEATPYEAGAAQRGFYARSKLIADRLMLQMARGGARVVVLRPGLLYGPGRRPPVGRQRFALGPLRIVLGRPDYRMPLSYVDNVADACALAGRAEGVDGRAYTIVDANVPLAEYLRAYRAASGERWRVVYLPGGALVPAAAALELVGRALGRAVPLTRHQLRRTTWSATYDCRRAESELGWQPRVGVEEALRRTFDEGAS